MITKCKFKSGMTLIELLVVLMILSIILAVVAPKLMTGMTTAKLRSEANNVIVTVKYLQGMASMQRAQHCIDFDLDNQSFTVSRGVSRNDDFEVSTDNMVGSTGYDLFPGEISAELDYSDVDYSDDLYTDTIDSDLLEKANPDLLVTNRNLAGKITIFDEENHKFPDGIKILSITDASGELYESGKYTLKLDPKGYASDTIIKIGTGEEGDTVYVIHVKVNGMIVMKREGVTNGQ